MPDLEVSIFNQKLKLSYKEDEKQRLLKAVETLNNNWNKFSHLHGKVSDLKIVTLISLELQDSIGDIEALKDRLLNKTYESIDIDSDAALYSRGSLYFDKDKKKACQDFHKIDDLELKNSFVESIPFDDVKEIAVRIMGRNYYSSLSTRVKDRFHDYMQSINEGNHFDFRGGKRNTIEKSLNDIRARLEDVSKLESDQVEILESFEKYLLEKD